MVKNQSREYIFTRIQLFTIKVDGFKMKKMVKEDLFFQMENILDHGKIMLDTVKENWENLIINWSWYTKEYGIPMNWLKVK